jgi:uncharacterized Ntn-hydrolase superfamily protein
MRVLVVLTGAVAGLAPPLAPQSVASRPAHTYSIVARDSVTGDLGVGVQSHWFSVGSVVPWAEPGVGAIATQSFVEPAYGPRALGLLRTGVPAPDVLAALLRADPDSQVRQVAVIDASGLVAAHTGSRNVPAAGHQTGAGYAVQANLMRSERIWPAMAAASRMLAALEAAEAAGGDIRGKQSAALVVVRGERSARPWEKVFDLRVEDSPDPLGELRRLLTVARAYRAATDGDNYVTAGQIDSALAAYGRAAALLPDSATNGELVYWQAVTLTGLGRLEDALPLFRRAFVQDRSWAELLWRLPRVGLLAADSATIARIVMSGSRE